MSARERAAHIIEKVAGSYRRFYDIEPYLWEYEPMLASGHFQDAIDEPGKFDIVILILESRLGTPLPERTAVREYRGMDGRSPVTGTEWEFENALVAARERGLPDLLVYRSKRAATVSTWDATSRKIVFEQLEALDAFWARHFTDQGKHILAFERFASLEEFSSKFERDIRRCVDLRIRALQSAEPGPRRKLWFEAPFRGLEAYELEHWPIFFGREEAIGSAMLRLVTNADAGRPFLLVLGASGSGKSSLVKAGILHELLIPHRVSGAAFLRLAKFRASDARADEDLFDALARCLTSRDREFAGLPELLGDSTSVADIARHLRAASAHPDLPFTMVLERLAQAACDEGRMLRYEQAKVILFIDQLEELFTADRVQPEERNAFVRLLAGLVRSGRVWVLATMRADFWHRAGETPELIELADGLGRLDLLPPAPSELSQMIRGPAETGEIAFEKSEVTGIPLNDLIAEEAAREPGSLPLLSYLLDQLYQRDVLESGGRVLTYASYVALGALKGAIATRADAVLAAQPHEVRQSLRHVLFALIQMSGTEAGIDRAVARRALMSEFPPGSSKRKLVEALLEPSARLLVGDASGPTATVCLAHEALISEWLTARRYIAENSEALRIRRAAEERRNRWKSLAPSGGPAGSEARSRNHSPLFVLRALLGTEHGLLTGIDLADGQRLLSDYRSDLSPELEAFIQRSVDQDRRRRQRTTRAVSMVAVVLFVLSMFSGVEWLRARHQGIVAQANAKTADQTTRFMVSLFDAANPETNRGAEITVHQALDAGAAAIGNDLEREPAVRAELLTAMGQAYSGLGEYQKAEALLLQARKDQATASIPDEARVRTLVASGKTAYLAGDYDQSVTFLRAAVAEARRGLRSSDVLRSEALAGLADALIAQGVYPEAEQLCLEALAADRKRGPEDGAVLAATLNSLGDAYFLSGELTSAEAPFREALELRKQAFKTNHTLTAESMNNLASLLYQEGRFAEAIKEYEKALPIYSELYRDDHPELAALLNNLGRSKLMAGQIDDAEPLLRKSLAMTEKFEGEDHDDLVAPLNSLGMIDAYRGRLDAARGELQRAESIALKRSHNDLLDQVLVNEADLDLAAGKFSQAAARLAQSKQLLQAQYPNDSANAWRYAVWDTVEAELAAVNGPTAEAERLLSAAALVLRQRYGPTGLYTLLANRRAQFISRRIAGNQP
jgi:tetratricopeptide (TPR) repeat protein